jgi:hypothetical protein
MPDIAWHTSIPLDGFVAGPDQSRENSLGKRGREVHGRSSKPWPDPLRRP